MFLGGVKWEYWNHDNFNLYQTNHSSEWSSGGD